MAPASAALAHPVRIATARHRRRACQAFRRRRGRRRRRMVLLGLAATATAARLREGRRTGGQRGRTCDQ
jgi:hypothetical protein